MFRHGRGFTTELHVDVIGPTGSGFKLRGLTRPCLAKASLRAVRLVKLVDGMRCKAPS